MIDIMLGQNIGKVCKISHTSGTTKLRVSYYLHYFLKTKLIHKTRGGSPIFENHTLIYYNLSKNWVRVNNIETKGLENKMRIKVRAFLFLL